MKKTILAIVAVILSLSAFSNGQEPRKLFRTEVNLGSCLPIGTELKEVFDIGFRPELRLFHTYKKFDFGPTVTLTYFANHPNEEVRENLLISGLGAKVNYNIMSELEIGSFLIAGFNYNFTNVYLSPKGSISNSSRGVLTGWGPSWEFGFGISSKAWNYRFLYNIISPKLSLDKEIQKELNDPEKLYEVYAFQKTKYNFNHLSISVGYQF